ncbi:MAG: hypothetical protein IH595_03185 [Bacteroidales bacterium]|nr:hypothetical protein [Bacteroidales bacterium]
MKNKIIQTVLIAIVIVLGYLIYDSIMTPVRFDAVKKEREAVVIKYLKGIRSAEFIYRQLNNRYTGSFDTLINFMGTAKIPVVKMIPDPKDTTYTRTINDTVGYVSVADSLFGKNPKFDYHKINIIPFSDDSIFKLQAGVISKGGVSVNVFQAEAPFTTYLYGLDKQLVINLIASQTQIKKYPGLKVGSMTEPSTDGNWE